MANICIRDGGTGDGSAWDNALDSLPSSLTRGNTYYIADGTYPAYTFDDAASGTTLITIKKATVADHGVATGWLDTYGDGTATFTGELAFATDYWVFDGVTRNEADWKEQVYGFRVQDSIVLSHLGNFPPGADHITVRYVDVGGAVGSTYPSIEGEPFYILNANPATDFTISRCFIHNCTLIQLAGVDGITIEYCYFMDMWAKEAIRGAATAKNGVIRYNIFEDTTQDTGVPGDEGTAPIAIWDGDSAGDFDNWEIYGNLFFDTTTIEHSGGAIVVGGNGGSWAGVAANNVKIYNNTIAGFLGDFSANILINGGTGNESSNNLWHNCIGTPSSSPNTATNGETASDIFVSVASGDFRLAEESAAGTTLAAPYDVDMDGVTRGSSGNWSRGAFQFTDGAAELNVTTLNVTGTLTVG